MTRSRKIHCSTQKRLYFLLFKVEFEFVNKLFHICGGKIGNKSLYIPIVIIKPTIPTLNRDIYAICGKPITDWYFHNTYYYNYLSNRFFLPIIENMNVRKI